MKQIVCLATSPWYPIPTRKQQVMRRLHDAEVLYFDPAVSLLAPLKDRSAAEKLRAWKAPGQKVTDHVTVYGLPPVWPFYNKYRWINRRNQRRAAAWIRQVMERHGFEKPVLWVYSPVCADLVEHVPHSALVYDCVDRHSAYGGLMDPALVDRMELELAARCDMVFATAEPLCRRLREANPRAAFIPNGADDALFRQAASPRPLPADLADVPEPRLGFVGALQRCIEYGWVENAARRNPGWSFVFIGGEKPGVDLSALKALPNVSFLGLKPHETLPDYLANFQVLLNLFDDSDLSRDVSPLKFYEYLATGKPIVSTPQPAQVQAYASIIQIARSADEFADRCAEALDDTAPERTEARLEAGRRSSWDARVGEMEETLRAMGIL